MAYCDRCGNLMNHIESLWIILKNGQHCIQDYQPDLYYYWDSPLEEDYNWRDAIPYADCLCEIVLTYSIQRKKSNGCANNISVTSKVDYSTLPIII